MLNPLQSFFFLLAYLAVLFVRPHEYVPSLMQAPLLPVLLITCFAIWLGRQPKRFDAPQHALLPVLLVMMAASVMFTGWLGGGLKVFNDFAPVLVLFYIVSTSVDSLQRLRQLFLLMSVVIVVLSLHGVDQLENGVGWTGALPIQGRITYLGFLNDPNDLSMAFLMVLPMTLYLAGTATRFLIRLACNAAAGLTVYAIYLTNSRGSILALGAMLFAYGVQRFGLVRSLVLSPLLLAPLIVLAPSRINEISADEDSAAGRVQAWYEGMQMFMSHPLFGVGKGQFVEHHGLTAHNSFVLAISELGLVGYFFWLSNIALSALMVYRLVRSEVPAEASAEDDKTDWIAIQRVARALMYGYIGTLVAAFFLSRSYVVILYLQMALIVAVHQMARMRWPSYPSLRAGPLIGKLFMLEVSSIAGLWLLTRILL